MARDQKDSVDAPQSGRSTSSPRPRQARRAPLEVQDLVLEAAHSLFTAHGYHGTKTRQIAELAGVGESVVFRNFGSKAELFEASILKPFVDFFDDWASSRTREPLDFDPEEITRSFVVGFYGVVSEHRELLMTLMTARVKGGDEALANVAAGISVRFTESLRIMRDMVLEHGGARDWVGIDPPATVAVAVGSVLSMVLLGDWIFPAGERRPGRARQIEELTQMLLHGISHRQAAP
jgi:AcrR family transcriptional regulator